jgi:hypothetical protein
MLMKLNYSSFIRVDAFDVERNASLVALGATRVAESAAKLKSNITFSFLFFFFFIIVAPKLSKFFVKSAQV